MALVGDLRETPLADLLRIYCAGRHTAAVHVVSGGPGNSARTGVVHVDSGEIVDARWAGLEGEPALRSALQLSSGSFQVELDVTPALRTVFGASAELLDAASSGERTLPAPSVRFDVTVPLHRLSGPALSLGPRLHGRPPPPEEWPPGLAGFKSGRQEPTSRLPTAWDVPDGGQPPHAVASQPARPAVPRELPRRAPEPAASPPSEEPAGGSAVRATRAPPDRYAPISELGRELAAGRPAARARPVPPPPPLVAQMEAALEESRRESESPTPGEGTPSPELLPEIPAPTARAHGSGPYAATAPFAAFASGAGRVFNAARARPSGIRWVVGLAAALVLGAGLALAVSAPWRTRRVAAATSQTPTLVPLPPPAIDGAGPGIAKAEVALAIGAPREGPDRELGRRYQLGLEVAFEEANAAGGVQGRSLALHPTDPVAGPSTDRAFFALVGSAGSGPVAAGMTWAGDQRRVFFGALSGARALRPSPPQRYVFTFRASEDEELTAAARYLLEVRGLRPEQIAAVPPDVSGDDVSGGLDRALRRVGGEGAASIHLGLPRAARDEDRTLAQLLAMRERVRAVVVRGSSRSSARFIQRARTAGSRAIFLALSAVGAESLAEELAKLNPRPAARVVITQVVPLATSRSTAVLAYQEALHRFASGERPDSVSLEGYFAGKVFLHGLQRAGREPTPDGLVTALETLHGLDLGLGAQVTFSPSQHQGLHRVWGVTIDAAGALQPLELD